MPVVPNKQPRRPVGCLNRARASLRFRSSGRIHGGSLTAGRNSLHVIPARVPGIHVFLVEPSLIKPAMTAESAPPIVTHMSKPRPPSARPLSILLSDVFSDAYARQGFAARELVTRWTEIAGADIAAHCEPLKMQWPRPVEGQPPEPATLVLRVEGPTALEIQHRSDVILERVNRFFGWHAVGRLALRQAPLSRRDRPTPPRAPDPAAVKRIADTLSAVEDPELRAALARLGASIKRN